jgi:hypothetical protein
MKPADRAEIAELLRDETMSYRAIGRELGVSDWLIRKVARELDGDPRPMRQLRSRSEETTDDVSPVAGWLVFGTVVACLALAIWVGVRSTPSPDSRDFSTGFYTDSSTERRDIETDYN